MLATGRMLRKQISLSEVVNKLPLKAALMFTWAIAHADDYGRMHGSPWRFKYEVVPMREDIDQTDIVETLSQLHQVGLIVWYLVGGEAYLQFPKWENHQTGLHKRTGSKFPEVPNEIIIPEFPGISRNLPPNRTEQKGTEQNRTISSLQIDEESDSYRLSLLLKELILRNSPKAKVPTNLQKWAAEIDRAIRIDARNPTDLERVVRWSQDDEFWMTNILSAKKLREQYDKLWMRMNRVPKWQPPSPRIVNEL